MNKNMFSSAKTLWKFGTSTHHFQISEKETLNELNNVIRWNSTQDALDFWHASGMPGKEFGDCWCSMRDYVIIA